MPHAALVTPAQMDAKGHVVKQTQNLVVCLDRAREIFHRVFAAFLHFIQRRCIDVGGIARRIDLYVSAAGFDQASNHLPFDARHVGNEIVRTPVNRLRILVIEALGDPIRSDQRHFGRPPGHAADEGIFF